MRQMKERREPMHILMEDCCPSFFTVPVLRSRIRPVNTQTADPVKIGQYNCTDNINMKTSEDSFTTNSWLSWVWHCSQKEVTSVHVPTDELKKKKQEDKVARTH